jgi:putative transposase
MALDERGITASMSRKSNCWDNACSETLFGSLKVERLHGQHFDTMRKAEDGDDISSNRPVKRYAF